MIWITSISCVLRCPLLLRVESEQGSCTHYKLHVSKSGREIEVPSAWDLRYEIQKRAKCQIFT
jgi:hypothetical protein